MLQKYKYLMIKVHKAVQFEDNFIYNFCVKYSQGLEGKFTCYKLLILKKDFKMLIQFIRPDLLKQSDWLPILPIEQHFEAKISFEKCYHILYFKMY